MKKCKMIVFYSLLLSIVLYSCGGGASMQTSNKEAVAKAKETAEMATNAADKSLTKTAMDGTYTYEYVEGDPMNTRIYTLKNGMKAYLSVNKEDPRIQTAIPVRAGSKNDPRDATGLAHYLEHMVFKGTSKIATSNWEEEKKLLSQISDLYEQHRNETDPAKRTEIYEEIDRVSYEASKLAVPNEYDKMISSLGAKYTNAYTSTDQTVYINNIPSSELEKWLMVESERFQELVLRLFHTELEAVYEEYNRAQDNDGRKIYSAIFENLFPNHHYNISTIGLGEHLKNPSMVKIHEFFDTYYVPNNVAICMSGDFEMSKTIRLIDQYFGDWQPKDVPEWTFEKEKPITEPIEVEVFGSEAEQVAIAYRFDGAGSYDALMLNLMNNILQNGQAGLMDLNLIQKQKILEGGAFQYAMTDYSIHQIRGKAREGQSLEEVKNMLLEQIELIKKGEFPSWLIDAVIKDFKLNELKGLESNWPRTSAMISAFIEDQPWERSVHFLDDIGNITREDVIKFANEHYGNNYVVVYKRNGKGEDGTKVPKPKITQVELNRENQSDFYKEFEKKESGRLEPVFLDYQKEIEQSELAAGVPFYYIHNELNPTFSLSYILDMGNYNNKKFGMAVEYLPYLGTDKYTAEQLQEEFYKLGLSFAVNTSYDRTYVTLSGLEESLEEGVKLFEHILANAKPDEEALQNMVAGILKQRADDKLNKNQIFWTGLYNYARFGANSPIKYILSESELKAVKAQELVDIIHSITGYQHYVFYYGQNKMDKAKQVLQQYHKVVGELMGYPEPAEFTELKTDKDKVLFVDYDMVQAQILMLSLENESFDKKLAPYAEVFGEYFGGGLSSIVFQEIREARALAYSAWAGYTTPGRLDRGHYVQAFMGVQADKMKDAIGAMRGLLNEMPKSEKQFEAAKTSVLKQLETDRITKTGKFFDYLAAKRLDLDYDIRKDIYTNAQSISLNDMDEFFKGHIANKPFTFIVMGKKDNLDMDYLKSLGEFKEVTLEDIFGY
ncbi:MAG: insulinase family protein [Chitinophagales bacterium]